jgi:hypothetical protein
LAQQRDDMSDEEKRRRRLGMSQGGQDPLGNFGATGVASVDLGMGMPGVGRR